MEIRPLTKAEQKYAYRQSQQIRGQTGSIGILRGGYGADKEFHSEFIALNGRLKTDEFDAELQEVLHSRGNGVLGNLEIMREFTLLHTQNGFPGAEYGFRVETEKNAYIVRCIPDKESGGVEIHCYVKEWLDGHISRAEKGIRFINSRYDELFRIADGEKIKITHPGGEEQERVCRYIDECHMEAGNSLYHICQFAEIMERNGSSYAPVESEERRAGDKEKGHKGKTERPYRDEFKKPLEEIKEDFSFRADNFKGEAWYDDLMTYMRIGMCQPKPEHIPELQKALKIMGYAACPTDHWEKQYLVPENTGRHQQKEIGRQGGGR